MLVADKLSDKQARRFLKEHPELLDSVSRILSDFDPLGIIDADTGGNYEREAGSIISQLAGFSNSRELGASLDDYLDWGQIHLVDEATIEAIAEVVWDTWTEYKNRHGL